jgi:hypothetical protein
MTDETRTVAEVAKTTGKVVRAASWAGGYLAAVLGSVPHDLVGVLGGDWLHEARRRNIAQLQANTDKLLDGIAADRRTEISGSVFLPLIEACVDEGRTELQALWAALLANAMVDGGRKVRRDFFDAVKKMEPQDALVLKIVGDILVTNPNPTPDQMLGEMRAKASQAGWSDLEMQVSRDALANLKCLLPSADQTRLTAFGRSLLDVCRPPS